MNNYLRYVGPGTKVKLADGRVGFVGDRTIQNGVNCWEIWQNKEDSQPAWVVEDQSGEVLSD